MRTVVDLVERIRAEFLEMPGLSLTPQQIERLCGIEATVCRVVLDTLTRSKFLCERPDGRYARLTEGTSRARPAVVTRPHQVSARHAS